MVHSWATNVDDPTVEPRWGKVGKQKIVDEGPLPPGPMPGIKYDMTTFDEVITASTIGFMDQAKKAGKPFFVWMNPTRAHVLTHLSPKYDAMRNPQTDFGLEEAALKQMDDNVGVVLDWLKTNGLDENTIVVFTTDNGAEAATHGRTVATPPSPVRKVRSRRDRFVSQPSFAGQAKCQPVRSRTESCPAWTGSPRWLPQQATR